MSHQLNIVIVEKRGHNKRTCPNEVLTSEPSGNGELREEEKKGKEKH